MVGEALANHMLQGMPQAPVFLGLPLDAQGRYVSALAFEYLAGGTLAQFLTSTWCVLGLHRRAALTPLRGATECAEAAEEV